MKNALFCTTVALMLSGCANLNSIYRGLDVNGKAVAVDMKQRGRVLCGRPGVGGHLR